MVFPSLCIRQAGCKILITRCDESLHQECGILFLLGSVSNNSRRDEQDNMKSECGEMP